MCNNFNNNFYCADGNLIHLLFLRLPETEVTEVIFGSYSSAEVELPTDLRLRLTIRNDHGYAGDEVGQAYVGQNITLDVSFEGGGKNFGSTVLQSPSTVCVHTVTQKVKNTVMRNVAVALFFAGRDNCTGKLSARID